MSSNTCIRTPLPLPLPSKESRDETWFACGVITNVFSSGHAAPDNSQTARYNFKRGG